MRRQVGGRRLQRGGEGREGQGVGELSARSVVWVYVTLGCSRSIARGPVGQCKRTAHESSVPLHTAQPPACRQAPATWCLPCRPLTGRLLVGSASFGLLGDAAAGAGNGGGNGGGRAAPAAPQLTYLVPPKKEAPPGDGANGGAAGAGGGGAVGEEEPKKKFETKLAEALRDAQVKLLKASAGAGRGSAIAVAALRRRLRAA